MIMVRELTNEELDEIASEFWDRDDQGNIVFDFAGFYKQAIDKARIQQMVRE